MTSAPAPGRVPEWTAGDRYRKARETTGLTVRAFADKIGVSHQTVTNTEKGHVKVRRVTTLAWSMATGVPTDWLETGTHRYDDPDGGDALPKISARGSTDRASDYGSEDLDSHRLILFPGPRHALVAA